MAIFYFILLTPVFLFSQQIAIEAINQNKKITPGKSHSFVFKVENISDSVFYMTTRITLPENWTLTARVNDMSIPGNNSKIQIVNVHIPATSKKGSYQLVYTVSEPKRGFSQSEIVNVAVPEIIKLSISPLEIPLFVKAGEPLKTSFIVKNEGNSDQRIFLFSENNTIEGGNTISLKTNGVHLVNMTMNTSATLKRLQNQTIKIEVQSEKDSLYRVFSYGHTKIIPIIEAENDVYQRFPVSISGAYITRYHNNTIKGGFQGEIFGRGAIDKKRTKFLEFRAVGPDRFDLASFGQYEEYYAKYISDNATVHIGDKAYMSSMLTELSRYGRGFEARIKLNKIEVGGFYNNPRFFAEIKDEISAFAKYNFNENASLKTGHLTKRLKDNTKANLQYISGKINLFKNTIVEMEYSLSSLSGKNDHAYYVQVQSNLNKFDVNAIYLKAGKDYAGYYKNTSFFSGNTRYKITPKLSILANYHTDARNFERDTLYGAKPYSERKYAGVAYNYSKKGFLAVYSGIQVHKDRSSLEKFNYKEKFTRLVLSQRIGIFDLNLVGQIAKTYNYLFDAERNSTSLTANVSFHKFRSTFNFYASYLNSNRYGNAEEEQYIYGARIVTKLNSKTSFRLYYQNMYSIEEYYRDRSLFEFQFNRKFSRNHEITLISRYSLLQKQTDSKDLSLSIKYTVKLNVPIRKIADYGVLSGRIENTGVEKIEGIKLYLNNHVAISDNQGVFKFVNLVLTVIFWKLIDQL